MIEEEVGFQGTFAAASFVIAPRPALSTGLTSNFLNPSTLACRASRLTQLVFEPQAAAT